MDTYTIPSQPELLPRDRVSRTGIAFMAMTVVAQLAAILLFSAVEILFPAYLDTEWINWVVTILSLYIFAALPTYFILKSVPASPPEKKKLSPKTFFLFLGIAFFFMIVGSYVGQFVNGAIDMITGGTQGSEITEAIQGSTLWLTALYSLIIAPFMEELFFRKFLVDRLSPLGGWVTIIVSGLFFGLFHGNIDQFFYAALLGCLLAYIYLNTGKLWHVVLIHSIINFFGGILPTLFTAGIPNFYEIMLGGDENAVIEMVETYPLQYLGYMLTSLLPFAFAIAGLIIFILYFKRLIRWVTPCTIPQGERAKTVCLNFGFIAFVLVSLFMMVLVIISNVLETAGGV